MVQIYVIICLTLCQHLLWSICMLSLGGEKWQFLICYLEFHYADPMQVTFEKNGYLTCDWESPQSKGENSSPYTPLKDQVKVSNTHQLVSWGWPTVGLCILGVTNCWLIKTMNKKCRFLLATCDKTYNIIPIKCDICIAVQNALKCLETSVISCQCSSRVREYVLNNGILNEFMLSMTDGGSGDWR